MWVLGNNVKIWESLGNTSPKKCGVWEIKLRNENFWEIKVQTCGFSEKVKTNVDFGK